MFLLTGKGSNTQKSIVNSDHMILISSHRVLFKVSKVLIFVDYESDLVLSQQPMICSLYLNIVEYLYVQLSLQFL